MLDYINKVIQKWLGVDKSNIKKTPFIIWGCHAFSEYLYHLLDENSEANVIAFIDNSKVINKQFCNKPVYSPDEFKKNDFTNIPIIVASPHQISYHTPVVDFESIYQFKINIQEITNRHGIKNHLLHPCALIDFVSIEYPNKVIAFGLPGSGITLLSHICAKIIEKHPDNFQTKNKVALFFEKMCYEFTQCIHQILTDLIHIGDGFNFHMSSWKIETTYAICSFENIRTLIYSFQTRNNVIGPVYNYHQIPSYQYLNKLLAQKYKLFLSKRNPLDVILSCINKGQGVDKNSDTINKETFYHTSKVIINQLNVWHPIPSIFNRFDYDNLIKNPILEITTMMERLAVAPCKTKAKKIWEQFSFKQLSTAPRNHFWSGGSGKWKKYFKDEHISFLKSQGIEQILENGNHIEELNQFKNDFSHISPNAWESHCENEFIDKAKKPVSAFFGDENHDTATYLKNLNGEINFATGDYFYIVANDNKQVEKIQNMFNNPYVKKVVLAGAHPEFRII